MEVCKECYKNHIKIANYEANIRETIDELIKLYYADNLGTKTQDKINEIIQKLKKVK